MGIGRTLSGALSLPAITAVAGLAVLAAVGWLIFMSFEVRRVPCYESSCLAAYSHSAIAGKLDRVD